MCGCADGGRGRARSPTANPNKFGLVSGISELKGSWSRDVVGSRYHGVVAIVEVEQYSNGDDGEYVVLSGKIGRVEYEVTVEDGMLGQRVSVRAVSGLRSLSAGKSVALVF